jgi:hypothetical protein
MILVRRTMRARIETAHSRANGRAKCLQLLAFLCALTDRHARIETAHSRDAGGFQRRETPP